jgi:hypothetical protein
LIVSAGARSRLLLGVNGMAGNKGKGLLAEKTTATKKAEKDKMKKAKKVQKDKAKNAISGSSHVTI